MSIRRLGLVGMAATAMAGMALAWLQAHQRELGSMRNRLNSDAPAIVAIQTDVPDAWAGWHFSGSGRHLISPERHRITPERLQGILWRDSMELRRAGLRSRREAEKRVLQGKVKVVVVDLADWHDKHFGSRAG